MSKNNWLILLLGVAALVGLFFILKPTTNIPTPTFTPESTLSAQNSSTSAQTSNTRSFDLVVKNKKLVSRPETLTVKEGDQVTINITCDQDEEFHLHGYDKSVELQTNKPTKLSFTADKTGRFPYELEHSKTEIGALEVQPK